MTTPGSVLERCFYGREQCDTSGEKPLAFACIAWAQVAAQRKLNRGRISGDEAEVIVAPALSSCWLDDVVRQHVEALRKIE